MSTSAAAVVSSAAAAVAAETCPECTKTIVAAKTVPHAVGSIDANTLVDVQVQFNSGKCDASSFIERQTFSLAAVPVDSLVLIHSWIAAEGSYYKTPYCQTTASFQDTARVKLNIPGRFISSFEDRQLPILMYYRGMKNVGKNTVHVLDFVNPDIVKRAG